MKDDWVFPRRQVGALRATGRFEPHMDDVLNGELKTQLINAGAGDTAGRLSFTISHRDDSSTFIPVDGHSSANNTQRVLVEPKKAQRHRLKRWAAHS
jgi:hypothetical protein